MLIPHAISLTRVLQDGAVLLLLGLLGSFGRTRGQIQRLEKRTLEEVDMEPADS